MLMLAGSGAGEGLWLRAERQTGGRGRHGRAWSSPEGNLYASTLVRLRPHDPQAATLALVAAVALEEVVAAYLLPGEGRGPVASGPMLGPGLRRGTIIKWPNDLLLDGAKLSGILLERADDAVVIGMGVNLAHYPNDLERPATSLAAHGAALIRPTSSKPLPTPSNAGSAPGGSRVSLRSAPAGSNARTPPAPRSPRACPTAARSTACFRA